jgi:c-di-GMP-binding flagellar brake protein YcgR
VSLSGANRRKFPRVNYPCLVVIEGSNSDQDPPAILTHTENVGIGGVCVILKDNIKIGTPVEVEIDLMDLEQHIKCQGRVVWNVQRRHDDKKKPLFYDIGIEFVNIDKNEQQRIDEIVRRHTTRFV